MRSYEAARSLYSFLGFCSWMVIIVGGIIAFGGATATSAFARNAGPIQAILAAAPGIIISVVGFYGLAIVQLGRAGVDSAEYAQQALQVSRDQLEVSRQVLEQSQKTAASYMLLARKQGASTPASEEIDEGPSFADRPKPTETTSPKTVAAIGANAATAQPEPPLSQTLDDLQTSENNKDELPALEQQEPVALQPLKEEPIPVIDPRQVTRQGGKFHVGNRAFKTLEQAERYASQLGVNPNAKLT